MFGLLYFWWSNRGLRVVRSGSMLAMAPHEITPRANNQQGTYPQPGESAATWVYASSRLQYLNRWVAGTRPTKLNIFELVVKSLTRRNRAVGELVRAACDLILRSRNQLRIDA